jgi:lysophospholipase L1-like esterase
MDNRGPVAMQDSRSRLVVCLGDSLVRGQTSANFVNVLNRLMRKDGLRFVNAGVNGNLAYNVLLRLKTVTDKKPDFVIILVGTNDVIGELAPQWGRRQRRTKRLPQLPTEQWYRDNMLKIVRCLKENTRAKVALASLPVLGEDLASAANKTVSTYNAHLKEIAAQERVAYLTVHERQAEYLAGTRPAGRAFEGDRRQTTGAILRHYLLGQSLDSISRRYGYLLLTDGIHLNSLGASFVTGEIEAFLRANA